MEDEGIERQKEVRKGREKDGKWSMGVGSAEDGDGMDLDSDMVVHR